MRSVIPACAAALISAGAWAAQYSEPDAADLDRLSQSMNAIHSLKGSFVQLDPNGAVEQGQVYIQKPGKMRFEYAPPSAILVVSDGIRVVVYNKTLKTVDRYPLWATPLNLLLSDRIDLKDSGTVSGIERRPGEIVVHARDKNGRMRGSIDITFSDPGLELKQWAVTDAQGLRTTVSIRDVQKGVSLQPDLFITHT